MFVCNSYRHRSGLEHPRFSYGMYVCSLLRDYFIMSIQHLRSKEFQALITNLVDLIPNNAADPKKTL
jgi:hypothetical protein